MKNNILKYKNFDLFTKNGFTLIELLVAISIIAILSSISIFALNDARKSGRDAKRKADIAQIASGFELYKADCNYYPNSLPTAGNPLTGGGCNSNTYIEAIPADPDTANKYGYVPLPPGCTGTSTCTKFQLWTALENTPASTPSYCTDIGACGGDACNFCITNP
jgi:prepilin-type N-terminal cleavage/methylation domain-containing protein